MTMFRDFNFKLLVIEQLMYWDETLSPAFSLREHMRAFGIDDLDAYVEANELEYTVLPEARTYFQELKIPADLLATVEELTFDGGHQAFMECAPIWDGEDDLFDVRSLDDLDLLPNLKLFTGRRALERMVPGSLQILSARGITARLALQSECSGHVVGADRSGLPPHRNPPDREPPSPSPDGATGRDHFEDQYTPPAGSAEDG